MKTKLLSEFKFKKDGDRHKTCLNCLSQMCCLHNRRKAQCKDCHGGSICQHKRMRWRCKECHGGSICDHHVIRYSCRICNPEGRIKGRIQSRKRYQDPHVRKMVQILNQLRYIRRGGGYGPKSVLSKYVGCGSQFLNCWLNYTERQYCVMNGPNQIDHINPIRLIRRDCEEDFHKYFSWKNTRVVPAKINLDKNRRLPTSHELEEQQCLIADFLDIQVFCN